MSTLVFNIICQLWETLFSGWFEIFKYTFFLKNGSRGFPTQDTSSLLLVRVGSRDGFASDFTIKLK